MRRLFGRPFRRDPGGGLNHPDQAQAVVTLQGDRPEAEGKIQDQCDAEPGAAERSVGEPPPGERDEARKASQVNPLGNASPELEAPEGLEVRRAEQPGTGMPAPEPPHGQVPAGGRIALEKPRTQQHIETLGLEPAGPEPEIQQVSAAGARPGAVATDGEELVIHGALASGPNLPPAGSQAPGPGLRSDRRSGLSR